MASLYVPATGQTPASASTYHRNASYPVTTALGKDAWGFMAFADNRAADEREAGAFEGVLAEIRDFSTNPEPKFPRPRFVLGVGDIKLAADKHANWDLWLATFKGATTRPTFYPVVGNWDSGDAEFNAKTVLPMAEGVVGNDPLNYYADVKNLRLIVSRDIKFTERAITTAPSAIQHVIVADHYPLFLLLGGADASVAARDDAQFSRMLLRHSDKVRALFVGHSHAYSRRRLGDSDEDKSAAASDVGAVYQVDCGNAGRASHGDPAATLVTVAVDGATLHLRVLQAPNRAPTKFRVIDGWSIPAPATTQPTKP
jgi:hypothetical protein